MINNMTINNMLNSIVPISRFNKGEANKIFDEVNKSGYKIVVKNNKPACVLITPETYQEMVEMIENYNLYLEAEKRMKDTNDSDFISSEDVFFNLGITKNEINNIEVDIEYLKEAVKDLKSLDHSQRLQVLKAIDKVAQNPLPNFEGGYGLVKERGIMKIIVISVR